MPVDKVHNNDNYKHVSWPEHIFNGTGVSTLGAHFKLNRTKQKTL